MNNTKLETIGHKRGYHPRDESLTVIAHLDFIDNAERWCQKNVQSGFWMNKRGWFSFRRLSDAQAFREGFGDE